MNPDYLNIIENVEIREIKKVSAKLKKLNHSKLDKAVHLLHDKFTEEFDCLDCANCCKTLGPAIKDIDIQRMAKHLKMRPSEFTDKYLKVDEDKDYVFNSLPCPFLLDNNECLIYPARPKACAEYPHTDRKNFYQIIDLSVKNAETCPIVAKVFDSLI